MKMDSCYLPCEHDIFYTEQQKDELNWRRLCRHGIYKVIQI